MESAAALDGVRVIDAATMLAAPMTTAALSDFGAEVIKIEHPRGDPQRHHGPAKGEEGLWWKVVSRNKHCITLDLSSEPGQDTFKALVAEADVVVENFRPGVMERWGLGWDELRSINPRLVMLRLTCFGQVGPYATRPGFGSLAEAMSGFAHITGHPGGPPTLPPFGLADGVAGISAAYAVMLALYHRDVHSGEGQMIDISLLEPLMAVLGPQPTVYDQTGFIAQRQGNASDNNAPRNLYQTGDGRWVAVSTSAGPSAVRCMELVGHPEVIDEPWFGKGRTRAEHREELDALVAPWFAARDRDTALKEMSDAGIAVAPVYDISEIMQDPQLEALSTFVSVEDPDLGPLRMQNVLFRMSATPGRIKWSGRRLGADDDHVSDMTTGRRLERPQ